jgi:hypothetical protein
VPADRSIAATGPTISLPKRIRVALADEPVVVVAIAPPSMSTVMPSLSSVRSRPPLSSSSTLALVSSKCTPLTMIEP